MLHWIQNRIARHKQNIMEAHVNDLKQYIRNKMENGIFEWTREGLFPYKPKVIELVRRDLEKNTDYSMLYKEEELLFGTRVTYKITKKGSKPTLVPTF